MSSRLLKLADKFERKLAKYAQAAGEADSTNVTLAVRPTVNTALGTLNFNAAMQKALQTAVNANPDMTGDFAANSFITNATLTGGKWVVDPKTSGLVPTGTLAKNPALTSVLAKVNAALIAAVAKELNRLSSSLNGTKITNHDTTVNGVTLEI